MKKLILIPLFLLVLLCCAACGKEYDVSTAPYNGEETVNVAFIVGIADGEAKLNTSIGELTRLPALTGSDFAFISPEGKPVCIGEPGSIKDLSDRGYTKVMLERIRAGVQAELAERLQNYRPAEGELDMAAALDLAVRRLASSAQEDRKNYLVLCCGGKSTAGLIRFQDTPVYRMDVDASVRELTEKLHLDMSGVDEVIWYGCGDYGSDGQPALSPAERDRLKEFYRKLFTALGAKKITFRDDLPGVEHYRFLDAPVTAMAVEGVVSGLQALPALEPAALIEAEESVLDTPVVISESQVCYRPDSDEFADRDAAEAAIRPVADFLLEHPSLQILIYSTCAGDEDDLPLSRARSDRVKGVLLASGVEASRILVADVRVEEDVYYVFGLGVGPEAGVNRKTVIMSADSELALRLLGAEAPAA